MDGFERTSPGVTLAPPKVAVRGLDITFPGQAGPPVAVLQGLDLELAAGEFLVIVGPSSYGKSTLLRVVSGLLLPSGACSPMSRSYS